MSYNLGSSEFDEIETLAYHRDYADHELRKSIEEALPSPEWYRAMKVEYESLQKTVVWGLDEKPERKNLVTGKWSLHLSETVMVKQIRHKARYVARGFKQKQAADYDQSDSPIVKMVRLKMATRIRSEKRHEQKLCL